MGLGGKMIKNFWNWMNEKIFRLYLGLMFLGWLVLIGCTLMNFTEFQTVVALIAIWLPLVAALIIKDIKKSNND
jgi:hypothetical protein